MTNIAVATVNQDENRQVGVSIHAPFGNIRRAPLLTASLNVDENGNLGVFVSGEGTGAISVPNEHFFPTETDRDAFFAGAEIEEDTYCVITTVPPMLQRYQNGNWVDITPVIQGPPGTISEAPADGKQYGRQNEQWTEVESTGSGALPSDDKYSVAHQGEWVDLFYKTEHSYNEIVARDEALHVYNRPEGGAAVGIFFFTRQDNLQEVFLKSITHKGVAVGRVHTIGYKVSTWFSYGTDPNGLNWKEYDKWLIRITTPDLNLNTYDLTNLNDPRIEYNPECLVNGKLWLPKNAIVGIGTPGLSGTFAYGDQQNNANDGFRYSGHEQGNSVLTSSLSNPAHGIIVFMEVAAKYRQEDLQEFNARIGSLELSQKKYEGKWVSFLGDSITTFSGWLPSGYPSYYPTGSVTNVEQTYWKKIINSLGLDLCVNNSYSGSRVTSGQTGSVIDLQRHTNLHNGTQVPDVIIINMGTNDFNYGVPMGSYCGVGNIPSSTSTFSEAYGVMLRDILNTYKKAKVWCCTIPGGERNGLIDFPERRTDGLELSEFNDIIRNVASAFGCRIIELAQCGMNTANVSVFTSDYNSSTGIGLHPNELGFELMATQAIGQMLSKATTSTAGRIPPAPRTGTFALKVVNGVLQWASE